jgi:hypothetical protein
LGGHDSRVRLSLLDERICVTLLERVVGTALNFNRPPRITETWTAYSIWPTGASCLKKRRSKHSLIEPCLFAGCGTVAAQLDQLFPQPFACIKRNHGLCYLNPIARSD